MEQARKSDSILVIKEEAIDAMPWTVSGANGHKIGRKINVQIIIHKQFLLLRPKVLKTTHITLYGDISVYSHTGI